MSWHPGTILVSIIISLALIFALVPSSSSAAQKQYTFAVVPNASPLMLHKRWTPFIERLSKDTGVEIKLKLYDSIDKFLDASEKGEPDFIYSAPNMFYLAYEKQGYIPMLRSDAKYRGRVFVKKESSISSIHELTGKKIAFVGPANLCSVFVRQQLSAGDTPVNFNRSYSGTTINVAKAVLMGQADAGATLDVNFDNDFPDLKSDLKIIYETPDVASHPIAAHPSVPKKLRRLIERTIVGYAKSESGKALLSEIKFSNPVKADLRRDYSVFKGIDYSKL